MNALRQHSYLVKGEAGPEALESALCRPDVRAALALILRELAAPLLAEVMRRQAEASAAPVHVASALGLRGERQAKRVLERHNIPGTKIDRRWYADPAALRAIVEAPPKMAAPSASTSASAPANDGSAPDELEAGADRVLADLLDGKGVRLDERAPTPKRRRAG